MAQLNSLNPVPAGWYPLHAQAVAVKAAAVVLPSLRLVPAAFRERAKAFNNSAGAGSAGGSVRVLGRAGSEHPNLGDQATRAVTSVALNLAEGSGRAGRDRLNHFRIAYGSALEASAALEMLAAVHGLPASVATQGLELLDRTRAMLWRLMNAR